MKEMDVKVEDAVVEEIMAENTRRNAALRSPYDPVAGIGACGPRVKVSAPDGEVCHVPREMLDDPGIEAASRDIAMWRRLRVSHDFEYWAAVCVTCLLYTSDAADE